MKLTVEEQRRVAQRANWFFDFYAGQNTGDSVIYTGDGVEDLDRLIAVIANGTFRDARLVCDVSPASYSQYRACDLEDIQAIRGYYVGWYGEVNKPTVLGSRESTAYPQPQQNVQVDP